MRRSVRRGQGLRGDLAGPTRSCTPARLRRSRARVRGSSTRSTLKRSDSSSRGHNATSPSAVPSSPPGSSGSGGGRMAPSDRAGPSRCSPCIGVCDSSARFDLVVAPHQTLMTIRLETTRVPAMTALRVLAGSCSTGADSPVIADSSTMATPSITVPSHGIRQPASTIKTSPLTSSDAGFVRPSSRVAATSGPAVRGVLVWAMSRRENPLRKRTAVPSVGRGELANVHLGRDYRGARGASPPLARLSRRRREALEYPLDRAARAS